MSWLGFVLLGWFIIDRSIDTGIELYLKKRPWAKGQDPLSLWVARLPNPSSDSINNNVKVRQSASR